MFLHMLSWASSLIVKSTARSNMLKGKETKIPAKTIFKSSISFLFYHLSASGCIFYKKFTPF